MTLKTNHLTAVENAGVPHWSDIQYFLAVVDRRSFRGAAAGLGASINSVRRRIDILERDLGVVLLTRHRHGIELTDDGRRFVEIAERMRHAALQLGRSFGTNPEAAAGHVRLAVTEGIGTYWLMPRLAELADSHRRLKLDITCTTAEPDLSRLDCDLSIQVTRPENPDVVAVRIGYLHLGLYAATDYIARYGEPQTVRELAGHTFVEQTNTPLPRDLLQQVVGADPEDFVRVTINTSSPHSMAILRGVGIGILPTYALALTTRLVPIIPDYHHRIEIWLAYNAEAEKLKRVRTIIDWVREIFDGRRYPWFREDYIPPGDLMAMIDKPSLLFEGFHDG